MAAFFTTDLLNYSNGQSLQSDSATKSPYVPRNNNIRRNGESLDDEITLDTSNSKQVRKKYKRKHHGKNGRSKRKCGCRFVRGKVMHDLFTNTQ